MPLPTPQRSLLLVGPGEHFSKHLVRRFAVEGFAVALIAKTRRHLDPLVAEISELGGVATSTTADVTDAAGLREAIAMVVRSLPPLSCVIYNVKASEPGGALELDPAALTTCLGVNVSGALSTMQAARPWLKDRRRVVILTGGGYKDKPNASKLALSVSKAALHSLFRSAAEPLHATGISLKTVVIDGVVRETGPLYPADVADSFWNLYMHPTRRSCRYPPKVTTPKGVAQLALFKGSPSDSASMGN